MFSKMLPHVGVLVVLIASLPSAQAQEQASDEFQIGAAAAMTRLATR